MRTHPAQFQRSSFGRDQTVLAGNEYSSAIIVQQFRYNLGKNAVRKFQISTRCHVIDPTASGVFGPCPLLAYLPKPAQMFLRVVFIRFRVIDKAETMWPRL